MAVLISKIYFGFALLLVEAGPLDFCSCRRYYYFLLTHNCWQKSGFNVCIIENFMNLVTGL